ncbi:MAG: transglutaminase family protein [Verrucomicrobiales bacterium]|nr:transglutaminase family protein [Verrucomicrobiales bacterium]
MAIHVALHHRTHYQYDRLVQLGPQIVRLRPAPHSRTRILSYSLRILPEKHFINWQQDPQSNYLARLAFPEPTREFLVEVDVVAEMSVFNPFDFFLEPDAERFPFRYAPELAHEIAPYLLTLPGTPKFEAYAAAVGKELIGGHFQPILAGHGVPHIQAASHIDTHHGGGQLPASGQLPVEEKVDDRPRTIDFLVGLNQRLWRDIRYLIRLEPGVQSPEETLEKGSGSCRDSAWLLCQLLRSYGLAARFVSGYLIQLTADVKSLDGPSGPEQDFTDLHAWCEVYLPGAGWIGLDPTSGLLAGEGHIPLAATPDPQSAAPITGLVDECECEFKFEMSVKRIHESPRVTLPYTEEQWQEIDRLGHQVDDDLRRYDCRLTMGGEPTFVSIDDMDGEEWNTAALGPTKPKLADDLIRRLKGRFSEGAFLHYGQGKWYPGESLPRWAYACYWRGDGEPTWERPELFADVGRDYGFNERDSERFIHRLADHLGCGAKWVMPAFEDTWYYLWKERRLPTNVDPFDSKLKNEEDRKRLARIFEQGLEKTIGHILPLQRQWDSWTSGPWFLRPERLYLLPGDSPIGFRLPLDSVPWVRQADYPHLTPQDPLEPRPALPPRQAFLVGRGQAAIPASPEAHIGWRPQGSPGAGPARPILPGEALRFPVRHESAPWIVRTALCVEPRNGRLYVFMPPVATLEDYLDCLAAVETTAAELDRPIVLEGYPPPHDPRLSVLKVTPDPGVLEVNIHPARSWSEMVRNTEVLYEEARLARLGTEKFMLDGRHTGTGGGNHIVLGGATPQESPLLKRPDLLRSLLAYWQNHPSLSFLFSSLFIGPTSQNPRVDEARNDSLRELEIAFRQVPEYGFAQPWLVDRLFRNLLVDSSGNTHRAEFCIDKLYSPDGSSGRLGLLELRAFEMPPHARMSLAQQLLLRTLISRFWKRPYENRLVRWGTDIHDRWMLPHFVWDDIKDVVADLNANGYPFKEEWFAPHLEFRFPQFGDLDVRNVHLELRQALEPWHVLGEEGAAGGTVRYVDSSLERIQVKVRGMVDSRHAVAVNGVLLPLHPTGTNGEAVAGVRYRAWQPPNCLHPTIGVHTPLVFDVVDQWNGRSIGGCTYHVMHPGGRNYTTFPVNAYEAESRRLARFFRHGHSIGTLKPAKLEDDPDYPFTLDLRRA